MVAWPSSSLTTLGVDALSQQDGRDRVPQIMQSDLWQPCPPGLADEHARERLWVHRSTVLGRNDQARIGVLGTPGQPLGCLMGAVTTDCLYVAEESGASLRWATATPSRAIKRGGGA